MHILIIEDEYTLAELIKEKLTKDDYIVDIETDGEEGYYKIQRNKYERKITPAFGKNPNGNHKQKSQEKHRRYSADF